MVLAIGTRRIITKQYSFEIGKRILLDLAKLQLQNYTIEYSEYAADLSSSLDAHTVTSRVFELQLFTSNFKSAPNFQVYLDAGADGNSAQVYELFDIKQKHLPHILYEKNRVLTSCAVGVRKINFRCRLTHGCFILTIKGDTFGSLKLRKCELFQKLQNLMAFLHCD